MQKNSKKGLTNCKKWYIMEMSKEVVCRQTVTNQEKIKKRGIIL